MSEAADIIRDLLSAVIEAYLAENDKLSKATNTRDPQLKKLISISNAKATKWKSVLEEQLHLLEQPVLPGMEGKFEAHAEVEGGVLQSITLRGPDGKPIENFEYTLRDYDNEPEEEDNTDTKCPCNLVVTLNKDARSRKKWLAKLEEALGRKPEHVVVADRVQVTYSFESGTDADDAKVKANALDFVLDQQVVPVTTSHVEDEGDVELLVVIGPENQLKDERIAKIEAKLGKKAADVTALGVGIDVLFYYKTEAEAETAYSTLTETEFPFITGSDISDKSRMGTAPE